MAVSSKINFSKLDDTKRIEAEYFRPEYLRQETILLKLKVFPLGKISKITDGEHGSPKLDDESGLVYLSGQNIKDNILDFRDVRYCSLDLHLRNLRAQLRRDNVLMSIVGTVGDASVVYTDVEGNTDRNVATIKDIDKRFSPYFISTFLNSKYGRFQTERLSTGNVQPLLNLLQVKKIIVPYISTKLQIAITENVKKAHQKLDDSFLNYAQADQLLLAELGLLEWKPKHTQSFVRRYSEATQARRTDAEYFQPKYQEMFDRLKPEVRLMPLGRLTKYKKGIEVGSDAYQESGIPFWRVSNLSKRGLENSNVNYIQEDLYNELREQYEPRQGELLLTKDATPGLAFYLESPLKGIISGGILRLIFTDSIEPHYLELVLNSIFVQLQIERSAGGSVIKHWKPSEVQQTWIPRLSKGIEQEISDFVRHSHEARREANRLLQLAKHAVEIAIEQDEQTALTSIAILEGQDNTDLV